LGETIQDKRGHCSVEDAIATMRLMKMKLDKGFEFGNVSLGWSYGSWARENGLTNSGARLGAKRPLSDNAADEEGGVLEPRPKRNRPSDEKRDNNDRQRCGKCGRAMNVECSVQDCKCRNSRASVCVVCCAQRPPKPSEEELGEQLDWSAALGKNSFIGRKPLVEEVMKMKGKSILCCANGQSCSFQSTSRAKFYDTRSFKSSNDLLRVIGGEILEHNLAMIEVDSRLISDCSDRPASVHIDNIVESIVSCASPKSLILLILSSPQESTCRISVKP
uniref:Exonuclease domain-containing protein n=1 Tax=Toxocara canis TaxID=6265 RepID=A0A183VFU7_TOXCA